MKKLVVMLFSFSLLFAFGCKKGGDALKKGETIKIGFIGPMTGDAGNYGKLMSQAIKIAVEEQNANGGIDGHKFEVIVEDSEGKIEKGNPAIEKLIGMDKVYGIVGAVFSGVSLGVAPKAEVTKTVMISPSSTHKDLPNKGKYIFRTVVGDDLQAKVFAKYIANIEKIKTVAILYTKNDYSQGLANDFKAQYEADGGKVVAMESGLQGDKDFKTQLTKIKGKKPEALYIPNYTAEIAQILEQSKQLGLNVKILSSDGFSNPAIFNLAGDLANGVIFANSAEDEDLDGSLKSAFEKKYSEKWGVKPDAFSMNSYDGANIIMNAIKKVYASSKIDKIKVQSVVESTKDYKGVSGIINFTSNGDLVKNMGIYISKDKKYIQQKVYKLDGGSLLEIK